MSPSPIASVSGIRGIVGQTISSDFAARMGIKFGSYLGEGAKVAIACDTRTTSPSLKDSVISGLIASGSTVYDLGMSSTPSVFKEVQVRKYSGGIVVTASHNPPEWNGLKFVLAGGRGVFEDEFDQIVNFDGHGAKEEEQEKKKKKNGRLIRRNAVYIEILKNKAGTKTASGVSVALDLAGGVGSLFIPSLLCNQGCSVHTIHDTPGIFPRIIDPTVDTLKPLRDLVISNKCNIGFAFDCDADRLVIVDQDGRKLSGDATLMICLEHFLENARNRTVAVSVDTSLAVEELVREYNGRIVYSKVGEANVARKIIENNCGAGGEGSSGGYIEPAFVMCRDGVYASTLIVKMIKSEGSLDTLLTRLNQYHQDRAKLEIDRTRVRSILDALAGSEGGEVDRTDGVKIRLAEKAWVLLRASNTENVMRISAEARSAQRAMELVDEYSRRTREIENHLSK